MGVPGLCSAFWSKERATLKLKGFFGKQLAEVEECIDCGFCEKRYPLDLPTREIVYRNYDLYLEYEKKCKAMQS